MSNPHKTRQVCSRANCFKQLSSSGTTGSETAGGRSWFLCPVEGAGLGERKGHSWQEEQPVQGREVGSRMTPQG